MSDIVKLADQNEGMMKQLMHRPHIHSTLTGALHIVIVLALPNL
jgi:hypothetical protein